MGYIVTDFSIISVEKEVLQGIKFRELKIRKIICVCVERMACENKILQRKNVKQLSNFERGRNFQRQSLAALRNAYIRYRSH